MKRVILSSKAPAPIGPYSQAIEANGTLYVSGQIPINPATGEVVAGGIEPQTQQVMKNIKFQKFCAKIRKINKLLFF